LRDPATLKGRYQAVEAMLIGDTVDSLQPLLRGIGDVERILSRVALRSARPRDLRQLCEALSRLPALRAQLSGMQSPQLHALRERIVPHHREQQLLADAIIDNPPMLIRDGGVIAEGFDDELDELRGIADNAISKRARKSVPALPRSSSATTAYTATTSRSARAMRPGRPTTMFAGKR